MLISKDSPKPSRNNEVKGYESKLALSFEFCQSSSEV